MAPTLNNILALITQIGQSHAMIHSVVNETVSDALDAGDLEYPAMIFSVTGGAFGSNQASYPLSVFFLDRMAIDRTNVREVQSDMHQIAGDLYSALRHPDLPWLIDNAASITYTEDETPDRLAGVKIDLRLSAAYDNSWCEWPNAAGELVIVSAGGAVIQSSEGESLTPQGFPIIANGVPISSFPTVVNVPSGALVTGLLPDGSNANFPYPTGGGGFHVFTGDGTNTYNAVPAGKTVVGILTGYGSITPDHFTQVGTTITLTDEDAVFKGTVTLLLQ